MAPDLLTRRSMMDKTPEDVLDVILFLCEKFSKDNYSAILVYYEQKDMMKQIIGDEKLWMERIGKQS